jgi:hypothetical protein
LLFILVYILCFLVTECVGGVIGGVCAWFFGTVSLAIRPLISGPYLSGCRTDCLGVGGSEPRWLWGLPPLFGIWVNCHGSYFFGLASYLSAGYVVISAANGEFLNCRDGDRQFRRSLGVVLIAPQAHSASTGRNPVSFYTRSMYSSKQSTSMNAIDEWLPPDLRSSRGIGFVFAIIGILLLCLVRRSTLYLRELMVVGTAFALALIHVRMAFVFGIVVSPVLCRLISPVHEEGRRRDHPIANGLLMSSFVAAMIWAWPGLAGIQEQIQKRTRARCGIIFSGRLNRAHDK